MKPVYGIQNQHAMELQSNVTPASGKTMSKENSDGPILEKNQS